MPTSYLLTGCLRPGGAILLMVKRKSSTSSLRQTMIRQMRNMTYATLRRIRSWRLSEVSIRPIGQILWCLLSVTIMKKNLNVIRFELSNSTLTSGLRSTGVSSRHEERFAITVLCNECSSVFDEKVTTYRILDKMPLLGKLQLCVKEKVNGTSHWPFPRWTVFPYT